MCPYCPCVCACVRFRTFRGRQLPPSADGFFLSFLFPLCFPLLLYRSPGRLSEMRLETFSPKKESHSLSEHSNRLKTYENQPGRGTYFRMLCLVGFSEKNIKKPEYLPRLVKKSIRDFISLRCLCLDEDSQSCNEALCSLFFPLPGE